MIFFHQTGRRNGAEPTDLLITPIVHTVKPEVQVECVVKNLLDHARKKISTLKHLKMMTDMNMKVAITTRKEATITHQEDIMKLKIT